MKKDIVYVPVSDMNGKNDMLVAIDWNRKGIEETVHAKIGEQEAVFKRDDLWKLAFMLSSPEMQEHLIPVETQEVRTYHKIVKIKANKPIKQGEELCARISFTVPVFAKAEELGAIQGFVVPKR